MTDRVIIRHSKEDLTRDDARQSGRVVYADDHSARHAGPRRLFWLLDFGVQMIYEPFGWPDAWYVDLVQIGAAQALGQVTYTVRDMEVDIIVEGMGPTYRIIDLELFGRRALAGEFTMADVADSLEATQTFLDAFLHRGAPWPPPLILPFFAPDHKYP